MKRVPKVEEFAVRRTSVLMTVCALAVPAWADTPTPAGETYAQALVDRALAAHPDLVNLEIFATPPKTDQAVVIATKTGKLGEKADAGDVKVIKTGEKATEVSKSGDKYEVELPLFDANGRTVGAVEATFPYKAGADKAKLDAEAAQVRDALAKRISHVANLVEQARFDSRVPLNTYAQALVDHELELHPEIVIMAIHSPIPKTQDNVITASNIGRIGKKADEDDMRVVNKGTENLEVNETKDRFEVEMPLFDVSGDTLGALGVVYRYKEGDDKTALQAKGEAVRDDLKRHISNVENLVEPYPYDPKVPSNTYAQKLVDQTMAKHPELLILALHATPPGGTVNIINGSSIGRIGKKADEDDMGVVNSGKTLTEVNSTGKRFEVESQLLDASGKSIGAVSAVFAYKAGDDKAQLQKQGEAIRDELRRQIPSNAKLFEPVSGT